MGYSRYWNRTSKPINEDFIAKMQEIIKTCTVKGIKLCNGSGEGKPIVSLEEVSLNGDRSRGLDYESFNIDNEDTGYNFCKTARKPYDAAVRLALVAAEECGLVTNVRDDDRGKNNTMYSDEDYLEYDRGDITYDELTGRNLEPKAKSKTDRLIEINNVDPTLFSEDEWNTNLINWANELDMSVGALLHELEKLNEDLNKQAMQEEIRFILNDTDMSGLLSDE